MQCKAVQIYIYICVSCSAAFTDKESGNMFQTLPKPLTSFQSYKDLFWSAGFNRGKEK